MSIQISFFRTSWPLLDQTREWWRSVDNKSRKCAAALSVAVACAVAAACSFLGSYIEEAFSNKAAANTALYMDSFVEPLVQGLGVGASLSAEARDHLERLLSPASIGKPVVAFRIWVDDCIVFSSRRDLIGKSFPTSAARASAANGEVVATFGSDSDDDEYERSLGVPILEIYAPIRRAGTHQIIAVAETAELASDLNAKIRAAQYTSYVLITSVAAGFLLTFFSLTGGLERRICDLTLLAEDCAERVSRASAHVVEKNERDLRGLAAELHSGPLQHAAFALLRVGDLRETSDRSDKDIESISKALEACVEQLRMISARFPASGVETQSLADTLDSAIRKHVLRTGVPITYDIGKLPQGSYALKACLNRFLEQSLNDAFEHAGAVAVQVSVKCKNAELEAEVYYKSSGPAFLPRNAFTRTKTLRYPIEALGGVILLKSQPNQTLSATATFRLLKPRGEIV